MGESTQWLDERVKDHNGQDHNSHLFKYSIESRHDPVLKNDFSSPCNLANLSGAQKCCHSCHCQQQCDGNFAKHFHISVEELYILKTFFTDLDGYLIKENIQGSKRKMYAN